MQSECSTRTGGSAAARFDSWDMVGMMMRRRRTDGVRRPRLACMSGER